MDQDFVPIRQFQAKQSTIPGAGIGLYTTRELLINQPLFIAFAPRGDNRQLYNQYNQISKAEGNLKPVFEAEYQQCYPNDFINHSEQPNCESIWDGDYIVVRAIKVIAPGEELFKDYRHTMELIEVRGFVMVDDFLNF